MAALPPAPERGAEIADRMRVVLLRHLPHDPQLRWQVIDKETETYLAGFEERDLAADYAASHGWTVAAD